MIFSSGLTHTPIQGKIIGFPQLAYVPLPKFVGAWDIGGTVGSAIVQFTKCIVALKSAVCNGLMDYNGTVMIPEQGAQFKAIASRAMVTAIKGWYRRL